MRKPSTFTLDEDLLRVLRRTRGRRSVSDRVNQLLRRGLEAERRAAREQAAAAFYAQPEPAAENAERKAFQRASLRSFLRD